MCPSGVIRTPRLVSFFLSYILFFFWLVDLHLLFTVLTVTCHLCTCPHTAGRQFVWQPVLSLKFFRPANSVSKVGFFLCFRVVHSWAAFGPKLLCPKPCFALFLAWLSKLQNSKQNNLQEELNKPVTSNKLWHCLWDLQVYLCAMWDSLHTDAHYSDCSVVQLWPRFMISSMVQYGGCQSAFPIPFVTAFSPFYYFAPSTHYSAFLHFHVSMCRDFLRW